MRRAALLEAALLAALALAGCSGQSAPPPAGDPVVAIEGWVLDDRLRPVPGAVVRAAGLGLQVPVAEDGHYALTPPAGQAVVLVAEAPGFRSASTAVGAGSGSRVWANFTLEQLPAGAPYQVVEAFNGFLRCAVVAHPLREDPARPHEHPGVRCRDAVPDDDTNAWDYRIPANTTGVVIEVAWEAQTEFSRTLVLRVQNSAGDDFAFIEGVSILRQQLSQSKLLDQLASGDPTLRVTLDASAGNGQPEAGDVGVFANQQFTVFATAFFNGPVDPDYSIADA